MTQYMLSVHYRADGVVPSAEDMERAYAQTDAVNKEMQQAGIWVFGGGLFPPDVATVVDNTGAELLTTDGPYAETKEQLGGFWILDLPDLDAALDWAAKSSAACLGPVEVRPFQAE